MSDIAKNHEPDDGAPFGTRPKRSPVPLIALWIAYGVWLLVLVWMAFLRSRG